MTTPQLLISVIILISLAILWFYKEKETERDIESKGKPAIQILLSQSVITFLLGAFIAMVITPMVQDKSSEIQRSFEMHKIKWSEMISLQKELLENLTARVYWLEETYINLVSSEKSTSEIDNAWKKYTDYTRTWNTNLLYWHSKLDVLFGEGLARKLVYDEETAVILNEDTLSQLEGKLPRKKTINKAFLTAESTVRTMLPKPPSEATIQSQEKLKQAKDKIEELKKLSDCFAHELSREILADPFDSSHQAFIPTDC